MIINLNNTTPLHKIGGRLSSLRSGGFMEAEYAIVNVQNIWVKFYGDSLCGIWMSSVGAFVCLCRNIIKSFRLMRALFWCNQSTLRVLKSSCCVFYIYRYLAITAPFKNVHLVKIFAMIAACWVWSFIVSGLSWRLLNHFLYKPYTTQVSYLKLL